MYARDVDGLETQVSLRTSSTKLFIDDSVQQSGKAHCTPLYVCGCAFPYRYVLCWYFPALKAFLFSEKNHGDIGFESPAEFEDLSYYRSINGFPEFIRIGSKAGNAGEGQKNSHTLLR